MNIQHSLKENIHEAQKSDADYLKLIDQIKSGKKPELQISDSGSVEIQNDKRSHLREGIRYETVVSKFVLTQFTLGMSRMTFFLRRGEERERAGGRSAFACLPPGRRREGKGATHGFFSLAARLYGLRPAG
ncbi:hypothetical protein KFK09_018192 [Dendrobium nobile]|uniref:Uncharacterized protein n=1 Tax=Dendrobium nobile TaxID=94219 RepID=A0A8T3AV98_DENNO|nr:hypothetical protein KFK09_018192 [Dendrobium nobile]